MPMVGKKKYPYTTAGKKAAKVAAKKAGTTVKKTGTYKGKSNKLGGGGRFKQVVEAVRKRGVRNPEAVAAAIGRKKYGAKKMTKMAVAGRKRAK